MPCLSEVHWASTACNSTEADTLMTHLSPKPKSGPGHIGRSAGMNAAGQKQNASQQDTVYAHPSCQDRAELAGLQG